MSSLASPLSLSSLISQPQISLFLSDLVMLSYSRQEITQVLLLQVTEWIVRFQSSLLSMSVCCDGKKSLELKESANAYYVSRHFATAGNMYSRALHLIKEIEDVSLAATLYNNRAGCFLHLNLLEHALADCEEALMLSPAYTKAKNRRVEVLDKLGRVCEKDFEGFELSVSALKCLKRVKRKKIMTTAVASTAASSASTSTKDRSERVYVLHDSVNLRETTKEGRFLTAATNIARGTLLWEESPLACVVRHARRSHFSSLALQDSKYEAQENSGDSEERKKRKDCRCGYCLSSISVCVNGASVVATCFPCPGCVSMCYCSTRCRAADRNAHLYECAHPLLSHLGDELLLAVRLYTLNITPSASTASTASKTPSSTPAFIASPATASTIPSSFHAATPSVSSFLVSFSSSSLQSLLPSLSLSDLLELQFQALLFTRFLPSHSSVKTELSTATTSTECASSLLSSTSSHLLFAGVFHSLCQIRANAFSITEMQEEEDNIEGIKSTGIYRNCKSSSSSSIQNNAVVQCEQVSTGLAVFGLSSLMNHSCQPNTAILFRKNRIVVHASEEIVANSAILHCYGAQHGEMTTTKRKEQLEKQYGFECMCHACVKGDDSFAWFACQVEGCEGALIPTVHFSSSSSSSLSSSTSHSSSSTIPDEERTLICDRCGGEERGGARLIRFETVAQKHFDEGVSEPHTERAEATLRHCLKLRQRLLFRNNRKLGETYDALGRVLSAQGKWKDADKHVTQSIVILESIFGNHSVQVAREKLKLAQLKNQQGLQIECSKLALQSKECLQLFSLPPAQLSLLQRLEG